MTEYSTMLILLLNDYIMFSSGFVDIVVPRVVSSPSDKAASIVDQRFNSYKTSERILHKPFTSPEGSDEDTWWHAEKVITVSLFRVMFVQHTQSVRKSLTLLLCPLSLSLAYSLSRWPNRAGWRGRTCCARLQRSELAPTWVAKAQRAVNVLHGTTTIL